MNTVNHRSRFNSLGVPVDNLTMQETVDNIIDLIALHREDGCARLIATLNVDFMVNSLGYFFATPRHPELLEILRSASIVTADGFPVVWLSHFFGQPLQERVTGADLVPALSKACAQHNYSIYLLGGRQIAAEAAANRLLADSPSLHVAGIECPMVYTEGDEATRYQEDDEAIVQRINEAKADVLFIGLGNPKQEQWFHRNRHRLNVPISIGIGGTFEFLAGSVKRAPKWVQHLNLEWVYRISQDPKRLWKRYVNGLMKFGLLALPIVVYRIQELIIPLKVRDNLPEWHTLWGSKDDVVKTMTLPAMVTGEMIFSLVDSLKQMNDSESLYIIDFSRVKRIQLAAYQDIFRLGQLFQQGEVNGILLGMKRSIQRRLESARIRDVFSESSVRSSFDDVRIPDLISKSGEMRCKSYVLHDAILVYFSGIVSGDSLKNIGLDIIIAETLKDKDCILDLSHIRLLETTGALSLYSLSKQLANAPYQLLFSGANHSVKQIFKLAKLEKSINFVSESEFHKRLFRK